MRKLTKFKRSIRAISPVVAVLLMIAIAVVASIVAYAWVTGYIGGQTDKAGKGIQLQSFNTQSNLVIYVQNTGQGIVHLKQDSSVYVNDNLKGILRSDGNDVADGALIPVNMGQTLELTIDYIAQPNEQLRIKIVTVEGTFMQATGNSGAVSSGSYSVVFSAGPGGTMDPTGTIPNIAQGIVYPIKAFAGNGYIFSSWTFSGLLQLNNPTSPSTTVSVGSSGSVTANFIPVNTPKLVFAPGTDGQSIFVNAVSSALTIQRQDAQGNAIITGNLPVALAISESTTGIFYSDSLGTNIITSTSIADGASSATVYYKDSIAGTPTITASTSGYSPVSTTFTIKSLTPTPGSVQVNFAVSPAGSGTTNPSVGAHTYDLNQRVPISTTAASGYTFSGWTSTGTITFDSDSSASTTAYIGSAGTITANFDAVQQGQNYQVTFVLGTGGASINPSAGSHTYADGSAVPISTTAASGYTFSGWTSTGTITFDSDSSASTNAHIASDGTITANFAPASGSTVQVTFAISPSGSGTTSPTGSQTYNYGQTVNIQATAGSGYTFSSWTFNGIIQINSPTSASTTATMLGDGTITANFISSSGNKLAFTTGTNQILARNVGSNPITIQRQTSSGTPITGGTTNVYLTTTSGGGKFYSNSACTNEITTYLTISSGSSANFWYKDTTTGTPTITATATNFASAQTTFTVNLLYSNFDGTNWLRGWTTGTQPPWYQSAVGEGVDGTQAAKSDSQTSGPLANNDGPFTSDVVDISLANTMTITFSYRVENTNDPTDLQLYWSNAANPNLNFPSSDFHLIANIGTPGNTGWNSYTLTFTRAANPTMFTTHFWFRFASTLSTHQGSGLLESVWIDNPTISVI